MCDICNEISMELERGNVINRPSIFNNIDLLILDITVFDKLYKEEDYIYRDYPCYVGTLEELNDILNTLHPRVAYAIKLRYGIDDGTVRTLRQVGKELNDVRGSRAQQIINQGLRRLRHPTRIKRLKVYHPTEADAKAIKMRRLLALHLMGVYPPKAVKDICQRIKRPYLKKAIKETDKDNVALQVRQSCGLTIRKCKKCGTVVLPNWDFCSKECQKAYKIIQVNCDYCNKLFDRKQSDLLYRSKIGYQHSYCSRKCLHKDKKGKPLGPRNF